MEDANHQVENEAKLFQTLNMLSFICSIVVLLKHASNFERYGLMSGNAFDKVVFHIQQYIAVDIGDAIVPIFFMVSGFLFFRNVTEGVVVRKTGKRLLSLGIPYIIWNTVYYVVYYLLTNIGLTAQFMNTERVAVSFHDILSAILMYKYNYVYWYVWQLLLYTVLTPVIRVIFKNKTASGTMLFVLFIAAERRVNLFSMQFTFFWYFFLGAYIGYFYYPVVLNLRIKKPWHIGILFVASQAVFILSQKYLGTILSIVYPVLLLPVLFYAASKLRCTKWRFIRASFFIYSLHSMVIEFVKKPLYLFLPQNGFGAVTNYVISSCVTVVAIYSVWWFMNRYIPRVYSVVTGGRS